MEENKSPETPALPVHEREPALPEHGREKALPEHRAPAALPSGDGNRPREEGRLGRHRNFRQRRGRRFERDGQQDRGPDRGP
ncbi:MAG: hypothetical protein JHD33_07960, partial [Chthoniobacterales bacterium]|nr:hypothetical protein [Chthoniobacterales bacterium]